MERGFILSLEGKSYFQQYWHILNKYISVLLKCHNVTAQGNTLTIKELNCDSNH